MGADWDEEEWGAWFDARWAEKHKAREAAAARAAREAAVGETFQARFGRQTVDDLDRRLAELFNGDAKARLELGLLLHGLAKRRGFVELGLPSFLAYAKQRVSQGARWANETRRLTRVLYEAPGLPIVAGALERGEVSWSMAWVVADYLSRFDRLSRGLDELSVELEERAVLALVRGKTVRQAKELVGERLERLRAAVEVQGSDEPEGQDGRDGQDEPRQSPEPVAATPEDDDIEYRRLERTVPLHEAWLIENVRLLFNALMHHETDDGLFVDAIVAEASSSMGLGSEEDGETFRRLQWEAAERRLLLARDGNERTRQRVAREALAEKRFAKLLHDSEPANDAGSVANGPPKPAPVEWRELPESVWALDAEIQRLCAELERAELDLCTMWVEFDRRDGWRRLGFASRSQYGRERLGLRRQAECELRARGHAFRSFPELYDAVRDRRIGVSAATMIAKIATCDTVPSWIERAEKRTVVHLREEIEAVRMSVRRGDGGLWPPDDDELAEARALERRVLAGELWTPMHGAMAECERDDASGTGGEYGDGDPGDVGDVDVNSADPRHESNDDPAPKIVRMSVREQAAIEGAPTTTYRFVLPRDVAFEFELAERVFEQMVPDTPERPRPSFLAWACLMLWAANRHEAEASCRQKWGEVYVRDLFRCQNPVCGSRSTVTPHHMRFRSQGGGDDDENMKTLCDVCHLEMVHERRTLVVEPPASNTRWLIGGRQSPWLEVVGREVVRRTA